MKTFKAAATISRSSSGQFVVTRRDPSTKRGDVVDARTKVVIKYLDGAMKRLASK